MSLNSGEYVSNKARKKIVVILGPTATGKTDASVEVAVKLKNHSIAAEIINADSMQIYNGFDVGTAKPTLQQMQQVRHHLFGFLPPTKDYNAASYVKTSSNLISEMHSRDVLPILVGGTNMYIEGVIWPSVIDMPTDETDSQQDDYQEHTTSELYEMLAAVDPERAAVLHKNDRKRIARSLYVKNLYGVKHSELIKRRLEVKKRIGPKYDVLIFAMLCGVTEHKRRIKERAQKMLQNGIIGECVQLMQLMETEKEMDIRRGVSQSIAYKELIPILKEAKEDNIAPDASTVERCAAALETATWQYAKRQNTWIRNRIQAEESVKTLCVDTTDLSTWDEAVGTMVKEISNWYRANVCRQAGVK